MTSCPDDELLARYVDGSLDAAEQRRIEEHAVGCASCGEVVHGLLSATRPERSNAQRTRAENPRAAPTGARGASAESRVEPGASLGRYVVQSELGAGGMGVVLLAYDPELDRNVALKVLHPGQGAGSAAERLQREARSMARLQHPNLVTALDAGVDRGRVYLAMELVEGGTLRQWLKSPRTEAQVLRVFDQVADGLQAAHDAGIVHRDFKPDNVLLDTTGRPRIADFGLAHIARDLTDHEHVGPVSARPSLTRTGTVMGTPAYMAPEQIAGQKSSAQTDQFAFCVALWEALEGSRPFAGGSLERLAEDVRAGRFQNPPRRMSRRVRAALTRGLRADPAERFPSMRELARALRPRSKLWIGLGAAAGAAALITAAVMWIPATRQAPAPAPCPAAEPDWTGIWDEPRREELRRTLADAHVQTTTIQQALSNLDVYARAWKRARQESCEATRVHRVQTEDMHELRTRCLARRRESFQELVAALRKSPATAADHAVLATLELPSIASCGDVEALLAAGVPPPPREIAPQVEELRKRLVAARATKAVGRYHAAWTEATEIASKCRKLGYRPLVAEALLLAAETSFEDERKKVYLEATWEAEAGRHDEVAAQCWVSLVDLAIEQGQAASAEDWAQRATSAIERLRGASELKARLLSLLARRKETAGEPSQAHALALDALAARHSPAGEESLADVPDLKTLVRTEVQLDNLVGAGQALARLQQVQRRLTGAEDAETTLYAARLAAERGDWASAIALHDQAIVRANSALDLASRAAGRATGDDDDGFTKILSTVGPVRRAHGILAAIVASRGDVLAAQRSWNEAAAEYERACREVEDNLGPRSTLLVPPLTGLSHAHRRLGRIPSARKLASRAVEISRARLGERDSVRAAALVALAFAELAEPQGSGACKLLEGWSDGPWRARLRAARDIAQAECLMKERKDAGAAQLLDAANEALRSDGMLANAQREELARVRVRLAR